MGEEVYQAAAEKGRVLQNPTAYGVLEAGKAGESLYRLDISLDFPEVPTFLVLPYPSPEYFTLFYSIYFTSPYVTTTTFTFTRFACVALSLPSEYYTLPSHCEVYQTLTVNSQDQNNISSRVRYCQPVYNVIACRKLMV